MSNLLKRGTTVSKTERIIDYNDKIKDKLFSLMSQRNNGSVDPDGFVNGLKADIVESLITDEEADADSLTGSDGTDSAVDAAQDASEFTAAALEEANQEVDQILNDANQQADLIIKEANAKAEEIMQTAKEQGMQQGLIQADHDLKIKTEELEQKLQQKQNELEEDYQKRRKQMEPELVELLLGVFEKVTKTVAEDNKEIILHLINSVMTKCELSKNFVIKVSPEDFKFVSANQGKIFCATNTEVQLDVVEDDSMKKNECLIETDAGIFNCGLDIELNNLIKEIKLLSCL